MARLLIELLNKGNDEDKRNILSDIIEIGFNYSIKEALKMADGRRKSTFGEKYSKKDQLIAISEMCKSKNELVRNYFERLLDYELICNNKFYRHGKHFKNKFIDVYSPYRFKNIKGELGRVINSQIREQGLVVCVKNGDYPHGVKLLPESEEGNIIKDSYLRYKKNLIESP